MSQNFYFFFINLHPLNESCDFVMFVMKVFFIYAKCHSTFDGTKPPAGSVTCRRVISHASVLQRPSAYYSFASPSTSLFKTSTR
jgi:hypothetical protein